jgi:hypothetical protein
MKVPVSPERITIVSGGQTGADRGALDAALARGVRCGGWCPTGRLDENGVIPDEYPVRPLPRGGFRERTLRNLLDSDATVVLFFDELDGGTAETVRLALKHTRPLKLIDANETTPSRAGERIAAFARRHNVRVLNIAGPRASSEPRAHAFAREAVTACLDALARQLPGT